MVSGKQSDVDRSGLARPDNPVQSPSGKYVLGVKAETADGGKSWRFTISQSGSVLFTSAEAFRTRDALFLLWDDNDRVWVYSGDNGTFFWERAADGSWQKRAFVENRSVPVPALLKQLKPGYFDTKK